MSLGPLLGAHKARLASCYKSLCPGSLAGALRNDDNSSGGLLHTCHVQAPAYPVSILMTPTATAVGAMEVILHVKDINLLEHK